MACQVLTSDKHPIQQFFVQQVLKTVCDVRRKAMAQPPSTREGTVRRQKQAVGCKRAVPGQAEAQTRPFQASKISNANNRNRTLQYITHKLGCALFQASLARS